RLDPRRAPHLGRALAGEQHGARALGHGAVDEARPVRARAGAGHEEIARLDLARVMMDARDERRRIAPREARARDLPEERTQMDGEGVGRGHVGGSKMSFTAPPFGSTVPAGGSWWERRPVPSMVGKRPRPIAVLTAS